MSEGASGTRVCSKCGYVFEPFEEHCPRCAHLASEHAAVADPGREGADRERHESTGHTRRLRRARRRGQVVVIIISLVGGAVLSFPVALILVLVGAAEGDRPVVVLLCCVLFALLFAVKIWDTINRFSPHTPDEPTVLYDAPEYTKSDWLKYLVVIGLGFAGICLVVTVYFRQIVVLGLMLLFCLGVIGIIALCALEVLRPRR